MAKPLSLQDAEVLASNLVALGYMARAYSRRPWGFRVIISGINGGARFRYTIEDAETPLELVLEHLRTGMTGESQAYREGVDVPDRRP